MPASRDNHDSRDPRATRGPRANPRLEKAATRPGHPLWSSGVGLAATRTLQGLILVLAASVVIWLFVTLSVVVIPVLLALIIASAIQPMVHFLRRRGMPAIVATWLVLLAIVIVISGVIWLIVWAVLNQWDELAEATQNGINSLQDFVNTLPFAASGDMLTQAWSWLSDFITSSGFSSGAIAGLSATATFFAGVGVFIVLLFFFLKDGNQIWEFILRPLHGAGYERAWRTGRAAASTFGDYVRGTTIVAAADAVGIGIGLFILQVPLAIPLTVIVFITAYIPIVGATLAGIIAALVALVTNGLVPAIIVVAIVVVVNQLEGNLLQPIVMGRSLKLHPLVVLLALTIGASVGGVLGAILAVPLTAAAWAMLQVWDGPDLPATIVRRKDADEARIPEDAHDKKTT